MACSLAYRSSSGAALSRLLKTTNVYKIITVKMSDESASYLPNNPSFSSHAIRIGNEPSRWTNHDMVPPICTSTIYEQKAPPNHEGLIYTRNENPTRSCLQACLAKLEETKHCLVFSSGIAAAATVTKWLKKGDHVVTQTDLYHGIFNLFKDLNSKTDEIDVTLVDASIPQNVENAIRPNTKLVWLETPTNPLMKLIDLKKIVSLVKTSNPSIIIACDNTFMTPYFQRPSTFGVDIVMHSCTKSIGGHSDILMGALCINNEELYKELWKAQIFSGTISSSFDCYLALRSLKTLEVRMQRHMSNALKIARFLEDHPMVERVFHPGLKSHPYHELSLRQCYGHSGIFSFNIKTRDFSISKKLLENVHLISVADSLGGTESTIKMPSRMPANCLTEEEMKSQGISDGLFRFSVGLENAEDLIADLDQALQKLK